MIPIRVHNNEKIMRGMRLRRPQVIISVGKPVDLDISGVSKGRASQEAAQRIKRAIEEL